MSAEVKLAHPVEAEGRTLDRLLMRRPRVRDMLAAEKRSGSDAEKEVAMFASLCEVAPSVIESLDLADYQALQEAYRGFLS